MWTANNQLRIYKQVPGRPTHSSDVHAARSGRSIYPPTYKESDVVDVSKREITQMMAIDGLDVMICIADTYLRVYSLPDFQLVTQLYKTKGCHLFAVNRRVHGDRPLYLCVAIKRRLVLYVWQGTLCSGFGGGTRLQYLQ